MAYLTEAKVNRAIRKAGIENVEFCRGDGYCYFVFDDGVRFETESVMVCYISQQSLDQWLSCASDFSSKFQPTTTEN